MPEESGRGELDMERRLGASVRMQDAPLRNPFPSIWTEAELDEARRVAADALPGLGPAAPARAFDAAMSVLGPGADSTTRELVALRRREEARSSADARALDRWRSGTGEDVPLPEGEDLVVWLLAERRRLLDAASFTEERAVRMPRGLDDGFAEAVGRAWNAAVGGGYAAAYAAVVAVAEPWRRQYRPVDTCAVPGDMGTHDDPERTVAVVRDAYGWQIASDGRLYGLVGGDMGYAATHVVLGIEDVGLEGWKEEPSDRISLSAAVRDAEAEKDRWFRRMAALAPTAGDGAEEAREAGRALGAYEASVRFAHVLQGLRPVSDENVA